MIRSTVATSKGGSGRWNPSSSPLQPFDPRVAGLGDPDIEAVDAGLELPVRRDPDDEGVDEAVAAGRGRFLEHPADGVLVDPEPDLLAVRIEPGPEPEGPPVRFLDGVVRRQGPGSAGPVLAPALDDDRQLDAVHGSNYCR